MVQMSDLEGCIEETNTERTQSPKTIFQFLHTIKFLPLNSILTNGAEWTDPPFSKEISQNACELCCCIGKYKIHQHFLQSLRQHFHYWQ